MCRSLPHSARANNTSALGAIPARLSSSRHLHNRHLARLGVGGSVISSLADYKACSESAFRSSHLATLALGSNILHSSHIIITMYSKLFASIILAASAQVHASPIAARQDPAYLSDLMQALNQNNLTTLAAVLTTWAGTEQGQQIANALPNGNYTVLAPSNAAFEPVLPGLQSDNSSVGPILSYHLINGSYPADVIAPARSHSIAATFLTNDTYVNLGGFPQVQVLEKTPEGNGVVVRRTIGNATVTSSTTHQNLIIHVIDTVLTPPPDLKAALSTSLVSRAPGGFSQLGAALIKVNQLDALNNAATRTVFAPIDDAFAAINSTVANLTNEQLTSVLQNHVINDKAVYSTELGSTPNANAASGAQLTFAVQDGVPYVSYNQTRARILRSDVAVKNGVVHVIDAVLA